MPTMYAPPGVVSIPSVTNGTLYRPDPSTGAINALTSDVGSLIEAGFRFVQALYDPNNVAITGGTIQLNAGSVAAPSYSFAGDAGRGMYSRAYGIGFSALGVAMVELDGSSQFRLRSTYSVGWSSGDPSAVSSDLLLSRDAANTLGQRNGTSAQAFNLYGTYTDGSNYERLAFVGGVGTQTIQAQSAGTGSANINLNLYSKGTGSIGAYNGAGQLMFNVFNPGGTLANYPFVTPGGAGQSVQYSAQGTDANIGISYSTKGTGAHAFSANGGLQFAVNSAANAVNALGVAGSVAGQPVLVAAQGSDANIPVQIANKGTAVMQFSGQTTGTVVGAAGTAAAIPTPAAYLTLNVNGTNYRVPLCN